MPVTTRRNPTDPDERAREDDLPAVDAAGEDPQGQLTFEEAPGALAPRRRFMARVARAGRFFELWVGNLSTLISLYLRHRGMTPPLPAPAPRETPSAFR